MNISYSDFFCCTCWTSPCLPLRRKLSCSKAWAWESNQMIDLVTLLFWNITPQQTNRLLTYLAFLLVDSLYLCQIITCIFLNKGWGAKNPGLIIAYIAATLNPEILKKNSGSGSGRKKKFRSCRVAGIRQGLMMYSLHWRDIADILFRLSSALGGGWGKGRGRAKGMQSAVLSWLLFPVLSRRHLSPTVKRHYPSYQSHTRSYASSQ